MRILHTSDWHVGRTFHGYSTLEAAARVLGGIPDLVRRHEVDVVVVAGDVYDLANPSADAVAVLRDALIAILDTGARVVMTSGNHDSAARLGFVGAFSAAAGLHVATAPELVDQPLELTDEHGPVDFYGIPFLQPELLRRVSWMPEASRTQNDVVSAAMDLVRATIAARDSAGRRSVVVAHTFVAGAESESSDSERAITRAPLEAGGVDSVPVGAFAGVDYAAVGHLHGRAELAPHVRYSGAPLHYSFKEAGKPRGAWLVDLDASGLHDVSWIDFAVPRPLKELRGTLEELLQDSALDKFGGHYIRAVYTDRSRQLDPMQRIKSRFPWCAEVAHEPAEGSEESGASYADRVRGKSDPEVIESFLGDVRNGVGASDDERTIVDAVIAEHDAEAVSR